VDPPRVELSSAGGMSSRRPPPPPGGGDDLLFLCPVSAGLSRTGNSSSDYRFRVRVMDGRNGCERDGTAAALCSVISIIRGIAAGGVALSCA